MRQTSWKHLSLTLELGMMQVRHGPVAAGNAGHVGRPRPLRRLHQMTTSIARDGRARKTKDPCRAVTSRGIIRSRHRHMTGCWRDYKRDFFDTSG